MAGWLVARLGRAVVGAWLIASLVFISSRLLGGGQEELALADATDLSHAAMVRTAASQEAAQQTVRQRLGLVLPIFYVTRSAAPLTTWQWHGTANQYHTWLVGLLHGQLGTSYRDGQPVTVMLQHALAYTLPLAGSVALVAVMLALALGLYLASGPASLLKRIITTALSSLQVIPLFLLALGLLLLFANPDFLNLLPVAGQAPADASGWQLASYWAARSLLPGLSLVLAVLPELTLPLVALLQHEARADYATTARAKGLTKARMLYRHALPNAVLPLLTTVTDLLPTLLAGTVVVEVLFALPGSGRLLAEAAAAHDYPIVVAGVLFTAITRLLGLVLADILYLVADPRLRLTL